MSEENSAVEEITKKIEKMAEENGWELTGNQQKIAKVKHRFFGEEWYRCPCYPQDDTIHGCGTEACKAEIEANGVCHCNLFRKPNSNQS